MPEQVVQTIEFQFLGNDAALSAAFSKAEASSKSHVAQVNKQFADIGKGINIRAHTLNMYQKAEKDAEDHAKKVNGIFGKIGQGIKSAAGGITSGIGSVFGGELLMKGLEQAGELAKELISIGFEFEETWQKAELRMSAFSGSTESAEATLQRFHKLAVDRALEFAPLAEGATKMEAVGFKADEVVHHITGITAAAQGLGRGAQDVDRIVGLFNLMADSGKAAGRGLIQLEKEGYGVYDILQKMTGASKGVLEARLKAGRVDPKVAIELLTEGWEQKFGDVANRVTHTFSDEQTRTLQQAGPLMAKGLQPMIEEGARGMQKLQAILAQAGPGFADGINKAMTVAAMALDRSLDYLITLAGIKLETHSPSKVFERMGESVMQGLAQGFLKGQDQPKSNLQEAFNRILNDPAIQTAIQAAAKKWNVSAELISAVMAVESRGNPNAKSGKGAKGWMQFVPGTAAKYGIAGRESDLGASTEAGAHYLHDLQTRFNNDLVMTLAGYNWGEGHVERSVASKGRFDQGALPSETKEYIRLIESLLGGTPRSRAAMNGPGAGIYGGVPTASMQTFSMAPDEEVKVSELNRIIAESQARLAQLDQAIAQAQSKAKGGGPDAMRAGIELTSTGGYFDQQERLKKVLSDTQAELENYVEAVRALHRAEEWNYLFGQSNGAPVSSQEIVAAMLAQQRSGPLTTTNDMATSIQLRPLEPLVGIPQKLDANTRAIEVNTQAQTDNFQRLTRGSNVFSEAGRQLRERSDPGATFDAKVAALVQMPDKIASTLTGFITQWDGTLKGAEQILIGGLKSVVLEPIAGIFKQQIDKWVSQMLINLVGDKIIGTTKVASETANTTAVTVNTVASTANTTALIALTTAMAAQAGSSFFDTLIHGAEAGAQNAAGGGLIIGPGGPTSDSVPAFLSNGEYVIQSSSVQRFGKKFFDQLNSDQPYHRFATGGMWSDVPVYSGNMNSPSRGDTHHHYQITLNAPVLGGTSHSAPRSRREYVEMLGSAFHEVMGHAS